MNQGGAYRKTHICTICGHEYIAKASNQIYCYAEKCLAVRDERRKEKVAIYQRKKLQTGKYKRKCLKCDKEFGTDHKFNRLCDDCNRLIKKNSDLQASDFGGSVVMRGRLGGI